MRFNFMSRAELQTLLEEIKIMPGHKTKLLNLIDYISELLPSFFDAGNSNYEAMLLRSDLASPGGSVTAHLPPQTSQSMAHGGRGSVVSSKSVKRVTSHGSMKQLFGSSAAVAPPSSQG
jgi:hypothetical protein